MVKKALFVIIALQLLSLSCFAFSDILDTETQKAVLDLQKLSIISGDTDGNFRPNDPITRGEFCKIISISTMNDSRPSKKTNAFRDCNAHWARSYIDSSYELGIVNGITPDIFKPNDFITTEQVNKMLVEALGYGQEAQQAGGYPLGYQAIANELGILNGVTTQKGENVSRGAVARMISNALDAPHYFVYRTQDGMLLRSKQKDSLRTQLQSYADMLPSLPEEPAGENTGSNDGALG